MATSGAEGEGRVPQRLQDGEVLHQPRAERGGGLDDIAGHGKTPHLLKFTLRHLCFLYKSSEICFA